MPAKRRSLHDDKAGTLEMAHDALRGYLGHVFVSVVFSLAPLEFQGEGDGVGEVVGIGRPEFFGGIGHPRMTTEALNEQEQDR
jgi:hypothetical protein